MKKLLYIGILMVGTAAFTSCASGDECKCDNGVTITEDDAEDSGVSLNEACNLAKIGDSTCKVE